MIDAADKPKNKHTIFVDSKKEGEIWPDNRMGRKKYRVIRRVTNCIGRKKVGTLWQSELG